MAKRVERENISVTVKKRIRRRSIRNYREMSMMVTLYKILVLAEKVREEVERKRYIATYSNGFLKRSGDDR